MTGTQHSYTRLFASPEYTVNHYEYEIDHISKTKNCTKNSRIQKSDSKHYASFEMPKKNQFFGRLETLENSEQNYYQHQRFKSQKSENYFFIRFRTLHNNLYQRIQKMETAFLRGNMHIVNPESHSKIRIKMNYVFLTA